MTALLSIMRAASASSTRCMLSASHLRQPRLHEDLCLCACRGGGPFTLNGDASPGLYDDPCNDALDLFVACLQAWLRRQHSMHAMRA